jgi:hypothetical protein
MLSFDGCDKCTLGGDFELHCGCRIMRHSVRKKLLGHSGTAIAHRRAGGGGGGSGGGGGGGGGDDMRRRRFTVSRAAAATQRRKVEQESSASFSRITAPKGS